jgi:hypothetical protein
MPTTDSASNIDARPTIEPITFEVIFSNRSVINNRNSSREDGNCHLNPVFKYDHTCSIGLDSGQ